MKSLLWFILGALLFAAVALGIGYVLAGMDMLVQGGAALALALVPSALTLAWVLYSYRTAPEMQLLASLGGSGVRMAIALGGGYFLTSFRPDQFDMTFWSWLILFYLCFLGFEITLLIRLQPNLNGSPQA